MKKKWLFRLFAFMTILAVSAGLPSASSFPAADASTLTDEAPSLVSITPDTAPNDLDTPITIAGAGFATSQSEDGLVLPSAWLNDVELQHVALVDSTTLTATVPWGMDTGAYTLKVVNPDGQQGSLDNAFTVAQGINRWSSDGPYGGFVDALSLGETGRQTVYATVNNVGLFRSRDGGASWKFIFNENGPENMASVDPTNPNRIYIAKRDKGLYRSDDGGDSWTPLPWPISNLQPQALRAFIRPEDGALFGAMDSRLTAMGCEWGCGLFQYDSVGRTWTRLQTPGILTDTTQVTAVGFDPVNAQIIYAGTKTGLVITSSDGGLTWSSLGQTPLATIGRLFVNPIGSHEPWVCGDSSQSSKGLYQLQNNIWELRGSPVTDVVFDPAAPDTAHQSIWIGGGYSISLSQDGGQTWTFISPDKDVMAIALDPASPQVIYSGGYGEGVQKTVNGGQDWHTVNTGLTGVVPNMLAVNPEDPSVVYGSVDSTGIYGSKNGGQSWERLTTSCGGPMMVDPANPQHVVAINCGNVLIADDGWHFNRMIALPGNANANLDTIGYTLIARNHQWFLGVGYRDPSIPWENEEESGSIYQSSDGENWTIIDAQQTLSAVTGLAFDPRDPHVIYAVTAVYREMPQNGGFLKSSDDGLTWQQSNTGLDGPSMIGNSHLAVEPAPPYRFLIGNAGSLFLSSDQGLSWAQIPGPCQLFGITPFNDLIFSPGEMPVLYAATTIGLFKSTDGADTWQRAQGSLGHFEIWSIATAATSDRQFLYVATVGGMSQPGLSPDASNPILGGGVYRNTTRILYRKFFLPIVSASR